MFAWELIFSEKIETFRNEEIKNLKSIASVNALSILVNNQGTFLVCIQCT